MSYREPSYKEIIISKVIVWIIIVSVFPFEFIKLIMNGLLKNHNYKTLLFGLAILQIYLIIRLIYPKDSKFKTINRFPCYFLDYEGKQDFSTIVIIGVLASALIGFSYGFSRSFFEFLGIFLAFYTVTERNEFLKYFPSYIMYKGHSLRMDAKYQDYINHKIVDDEPHLTINQNFDISFKSIPRNDSEKNLIEIKNPNTPINPALVYKIKDKFLANFLRDGFVLSAKLIEIKENGNLEIELSLLKPFNFKEDEITEFIKQISKK